MNNLLIVESPSKCKKIQQYLGPNYRCIASYGHFRVLKRYTADFLPVYDFDSIKTKYIDKLRSTIDEYRDSGRIFLATDDDREGEAIAWHLCDAFHLPITTPRIVFHEITKPALIHAVQSPTVLNMNLVKSQQIRQILDMMIGFKVSPFLWKQSTKTDFLSAGRCQTPALRLVLES